MNKYTTIELLEELTKRYKNDIDTYQKVLDELTSENIELKNLCDKYEEEHKTTFEQWKKDINKIDKAIEYIEIGLANEEEAEELLNILKGDNNE